MRLPTCRGFDWEDDSEEGGEESEVGEGGGRGRAWPFPRLQQAARGPEQHLPPLHTNGEEMGA